MEQGPLLKITTVPYESVKFSQGGGLVTKEQVSAEKQRALRIANLRLSEAGADSYTYARRVRQRYSQAAAGFQRAADVSKSTAASQFKNADSSVVPDSTPSVSEQEAASTRFVSQQVARNNAQLSEQQANYYQERGALEMKVQVGSLSFVPPLSMTIVTQRPDIQIEYLGDFNYFPPVDESGVNLNLLS